MRRHVLALLVITGLVTWCADGVARTGTEDGQAVAAGPLAAPTASSFAYPQSVFVDAQHGNVWVTDFDNNRVLRFDVSTLTGVASPAMRNPPDEFALSQNYPNPFNPSTTLSFALPQTEFATLTVTNVLGQTVAILFSGTAHAGERIAVAFSGRSVPSGMYFAILRSAHRYEIRKMSCLK